MPEDNTTAGQYRQKVYDAIQSTIGRTMTPNEHKFIKSTLLAYVKAHAPTAPIESNEKPREHKFICVKCHNETSGKGRDFYKKHNKRIVKDEIQTEAKEGVEAQGA